VCGVATANVTSSRRAPSCSRVSAIFFGRLVVTYDRCAPFRQQPRKQTIAAADVQDALLAQIAQYLLDSGKMQPSAEGVFLDVACVVLDLAEVGHGAILVAETYSRNPG